MLTTGEVKSYTPLSKELLKLMPKKKQIKYPNLRAGSDGRPEEYNISLVKRADEYMNIERLPTMEGLSLYLNVDDDTLVRWANKLIDKEKGMKKSNLAHPEFYATIKKLKSKQKNVLIQDGFYLGKKVNVNMAIFLLKVNHGMVETEHIDHTTKGKEIPSPIYGGKSVNKEV